jgi:hypothetical protein
MGVVGIAQEWFKSYLEGRSQCVDIGGALSDFMELAISVIQGSTLGPLLFLCYINDFWKCTSMFSALFADNTTGLAKGPVLADVIAYVNCELQKMANWFRSNKMCLNASKTKYIIFRTPNNPVDPAVCHVVYNCNEIGSPDDPALISPIERISSQSRESSFKLLGVHIDEHLSFKQHRHPLLKTCKIVVLPKPCKNFIDKPSLVKLYYSMFHSNIPFGINIYGCANTTNLEKLRVKQKQAIHIISNAPFRAHTAPLFKELKILPLDQLIEYSRIKFMHSYHFKKPPPSFNEMWKTN